MQRQDFQKQMQKMTNVFSDKAYPDERVEQIWSWAKKLDLNVFSQIVEKLISECERPPLLAKFKEAYSEVRRHLPHEQKKIECLYCNGDGFYIPHEALPLPAVFACRCAAGDLIPNYVPRFRGILQKWIPTKSELAWNHRPTDIIKKIIDDKTDIADF